MNTDIATTKFVMQKMLMRKDGRQPIENMAFLEAEIERLRAALVQARTDLRYLPCREGTSKARSIAEAISRIDAALANEGK